MAHPRKLLIASTATLLAAGTLAACSSVVNPGGGDESLTIYSNSVSDGRGDWLKEQAAEQGFDLQIVDMGGGDVYNRLLAEKANPIADVTFGMNDVYFQKLVDNDVLEKYTPAWADKIDADAVDPSEMYYPIVREPIMLVCNDAAFAKPEDMPQDWPDLWEKEQFHNRYEVPASLGGATVQMVISGILTRYEDPNGKLGISDDGWNAISQWYGNGVRSEQGTDLYAQMKTGKVDCGQMWQAGKVTREKQYEITTSAAHPAIGVPMVRQGVALVNGTKHEEQAKKFIDWFGSAEVQAAWSKQFATAPMNKDAIADGNAEAIAFTESFKEQKLDWKFVADNLDSWIEEIQLNYVK
ncbi:extracellular solute-binding protein [Corynebacterium choanae]|uniref:Bacterial extracellular solute-binding protein n=1 Tax=Corynebacterium choanae TaxID=1862358 RepID=A0A3G6J9G3_9CORY|nr:extracellular solute-binding protein [Corynebacterium choanae]AZA14707.1 Bacterial extracellular solute-binding protein [Corynebacterium choanae]